MFLKQLKQCRNNHSWFWAFLNLLLMKNTFTREEVIDLLAQILYADIRKSTFPDGSINVVDKEDFDEWIRIYVDHNFVDWEIEHYQYLLDNKQ